jgi:hypothetical protein
MDNSDLIFVLVIFLVATITIIVVLEWLHARFKN